MNGMTYIAGFHVHHVDFEAIVAVGQGTVIHHPSMSAERESSIKQGNGICMHGQMMMMMDKLPRRGVLTRSRLPRGTNLTPSFSLFFHSD